jgi:ribosomal protein L11 methylase PrmA
VVTWLWDGPPDETEIAQALGGSDWRVEKVADVNWLEHSYKQFAPFSVGEFFIYGSHYEGAPPPGRIPLLIDAATAFGSGEHGTTAGCLRALLVLQDEGFKPRRDALVASTKAGGRIILSGMIDDQGAEVQAAYEKRGCRTLRHFSQAGWTALLLEKPWT